MASTSRSAVLALATGTAIALSSGGSAGAPIPHGLRGLALPEAPRMAPVAPVHGHHHEHRSGVLLRFDSQLGVYRVPGSEDVYYFADAFMRVRSGRWEFSELPSGPWSPGRVEWVPLTLRTELYRR